VVWEFLVFILPAMSRINFDPEFVYFAHYQSFSMLGLLISLSIILQDIAENEVRRVKWGLALGGVAVGFSLLKVGFSTSKIVELKNSRLPVYQENYQEYFSFKATLSESPLDAQKADEKLFISTGGVRKGDMELIIKNLF
jgi:hypothetical protein